MFSYVRRTWTTAILSALIAWSFADRFFLLGIPSLVHIPFGLIFYMSSSIWALNFSIWIIHFLFIYLTIYLFITLALKLASRILK